MVDVRLGNIGVEILTLNESQKELVDHLNVGPCHFQHGFILLGVECLPLRRQGRRNGTKEVLGEHLDYPGVHGFRDYRAVVGDVVQKLMQRQPLDLLGLHVCGRVIEIKDDIALIDLLHEEILAAIGRDFMETRELLQFSLALVGDIESRRVLALGSPDPFRHILWRCLETIENIGFPGRCQISRHGLGRTRWGSMLYHKTQSISKVATTLRRGITRLTALGLITTLGAPPLVGVEGPLFPWPVPWGADGNCALSGALPLVSFTDVLDDVGVPWFGDADCC